MSRRIHSACISYWTLVMLGVYRWLEKATQGVRFFGSDQRYHFTQKNAQLLLLKRLHWCEALAKEANMCMAKEVVPYAWVELKLPDLASVTRRESVKHHTC